MPDGDPDVLRVAEQGLVAEHMGLGQVLAGAEEAGVSHAHIYHGQAVGQKVLTGPYDYGHSAKLSRKILRRLARTAGEKPNRRRRVSFRRWVGTYWNHADVFARVPTTG